MAKEDSKKDISSVQLNEDDNLNKLGFNSRSPSFSSIQQSASAIHSRQSNVNLLIKFLF